MKYKVGDLVEIDIWKAPNIVGRIIDIQDNLYIVRFKSGNVVKFTEREIANIVNYNKTK